MSENRKEKHRLNSFINVDTYKSLNDFIKNNKVITNKLSKGTIITIDLNLLFKTIEHRCISQLMIGYLQNQNTTADVTLTD